jgi:putative ABC transport system permease protein
MMRHRIPLAWLQLKHERMRFAAGVLGVTFAVTLVFMQIGFQQALFTTAIEVARHLVADIVLINPQTEFVAVARSFPRRRLYQAAAYKEVQSVSSLYCAMGNWRNLDTGGARQIWVVGFDPDSAAFDLSAVNRNAALLRHPDYLFFDSSSRPEYGPIAQDFQDHQAIHAEIEDRRITVAGLYTLGVSFGFDGSVMTSDLNFLRLFPDHKPGAVNVGLIRLKPGVDARAMRRRLAAELPHDVEVLTRDEFIARERNYWATSAPIGYVFGFGTAMGLIVGAVIVYQILFADVTAHLPEYATLKAIGYTNSYLYRVVFEEAIILALLGYVPGTAICWWLYRLTQNATLLPMQLRPATAVLVLALTIAMGCASAAVALGKVRSADPAAVF